MVNEIVLKEDELLEIKGDRIFKDLFNEYEMNTIEWLVMKILNCKYEDIHNKVKVGGTESPSLSKDDKRKRLDLVVYYKNKIINIELNNNAGLEYVRNAHYIANRVINSYLIGEDYDKATQGILVNLNWFKTKEDIENTDRVTEMYWEYPSLKKDKPKYFIKFINVNLSKMQQICYTDIKEEEIVWKLFTIKNTKELDNYIVNEKMLNNYSKKLKRLSKDKEYCQMIWDERIENALRRHDDYVNGKNEGERIGIDIGIEQKQREMIINLNKNGVSLDLISKSSGLSIDEVKNIIKSKELENK